MTAWVNTPASLSLDAELDKAFPQRDKSSDGTIGNQAHAAERSDHNPDETGKTPYEDADNINEVHARDLDDDLRKAGWSMQRVVDIIVGRHRMGKDDRLQNVIYNRHIWSRSWGWTRRDYNGASPHTEHAHFSFRYGSGSGTNNPENDTSPWGILAAIAKEEGDMTKDELLEVLNSPEGRDAIGKALLFAKVGETDLSVGSHLLRLRQDVATIKNLVIPPQ